MSRAPREITQGKTTTQVVTTAAQLHEAVTARLADAQQHSPSSESARLSVGFVPTMGALHAGHRALAEQAVVENDVTVASIFVNPLQFGDAADLSRYPRTLDADVALLSEAGVDFAFAPSVAEVYPNGEPQVRVSSGALGELFEGASRPGHFDGALTVVAKLLHLVQPRAQAEFRAYFGQKDAQQLALVRSMVADLNFPVSIIGVPIVRDDDGLALSSRNAFLSAEERTAALVLSAALRQLSEELSLSHEQSNDSTSAKSGFTASISRARNLVESEPLVNLDYLEVLDPRSFVPIERFPAEEPVVAIVAAKVGSVRLIDAITIYRGTTSNA